MRQIIQYELFESNDSIEAALSKFKIVFEDYCKERKEDQDIHDRALKLLDEMTANADPQFTVWLTQGKTLRLKELLIKTTYEGNGNTPAQLLDFNAFALLDTVSWKKNLTK